MAGRRAEGPAANDVWAMADTAACPTALALPDDGEHLRQYEIAKAKLARELPSRRLNRYPEDGYRSVDDIGE